MAQDECWDALTEEDRKQLIADAPGWLTPDSISKDYRSFTQHAKTFGIGWATARTSWLFTTANDQRVRREFCHLYELRFPAIWKPAVRLIGSLHRPS